MLNLDEIKKFYSNNLTNTRAMLVEYLQHRILSLIYSTNLGEGLIFQGGTSIRILYGSTRFSEDLDFDVSTITKDRFDKLTEHISRELNKEGYVTEFRNVKKGVYRCYLRFVGLLQQYSLSGHADEKILVQLDVNSDVDEMETVTKTINKFGIFKEIVTYPSDILLSKKIQTLLERKRTKGRDIYDVVYLSSFNTPNYDYLKRTTDIRDKKDLHKSLADFCKKSNLNMLAKDVQPFLMDQSQIESVRGFERWVEQHYGTKK